MADEDQGKRDDLFEDLDKFFAPIQDVEWPEPGEPGGEPPRQAPSDEEREPLREEPGGVVATDDTIVLEESDEVSPGSEEETGYEASVPQEQSPDQAGLFVEDIEEVEEVEDEEISVETLTASPPPEYEELPGPVDDEEMGAAMGEDRSSDETEGDFGESADVGGEIEEADAAGADEEPSPEAVEAAAEHFAESVRTEGPATPGTSGTPGTGAGWPDDVGDEGYSTEELTTEGMPAGPAEVEESLLADLDQATPTRTVRVGISEGLGGPSWQEASTHEVGPDHDRRPGGRDMPAAFITGLVLALVAIGSLAISEATFAVVASIIVLIGQGELYGVMHRHHHQPATAVGLVSGALILSAAYLKGEPAMLGMAALSAIATFVWFMAAPAGHRKDVMSEVGHTLLGVIYVPLLAAYTLAMLSLPDGTNLVAWVLILTFAFDTLAFVGGSWFGGSAFRRPMAETISPTKSWEGLIVGTFVVILLSLALVPSYVDAFSDRLAWALGLAVVVAAAATLGDLAESLIKRDLGVKDMGGILPGHGGVLDRIDSLLFVAPAAFLYIRLLVT